jgi:hypothetical protein
MSAPIRQICENPVRLVSLLQIMKHYDSAILLNLAELAGMFRAPFVPQWEETRDAQILDEGFKNDLITVLVDFGKHVADLELTASLASIMKALLLLKGECSFGEYKKLISEIQGRLKDEMAMRKFFSLDTAESEQYATPLRGWEEVVHRFPIALSDIEEMSKCFALSRYAGAVFHSVNVIECGLLDLGKFIGVQDPKSGWTAVSGRLETLVIKTKFPDLAPEIKPHFQFLEQVHGTVASLKNAWRNKISHTQGRLTVMTADFNYEVAEEIIMATRAFMRRLATELPENMP